MPGVAAIICEDRLDNGSSCLMVTPLVKNCAINTYDLYLKNGTPIATNQTLNILINDTAKDGIIGTFNFSNHTGDYIITLCDGTWREFRVTETYDSKFQKEEDARVDIAFVVGVIALIVIMLAIAFWLSEEHALLRLLFIFGGVSLTILIPATFIIDNSEMVLYKSTLWIVRIFWIYVGVYLFYYFYKKLKGTVPGAGEDETKP